MFRPVILICFAAFSPTISGVSWRISRWRDQCAAWTGYYGPKLIYPFKLIICPENYYDKLGTELVDSIIKEFCSVENQQDTKYGNYVHQILNMVGYLKHDDIGKICDPVKMNNDTVKKSLLFGPSGINTSEQQEAFHQKFRQLYANFMDKHIPDYKVLKNNLNKYKLVKMMAREYCHPGLDEFFDDEQDNLGKKMLPKIPINFSDVCKKLQI